MTSPPIPPPAREPGPGPEADPGAGPGAAPGAGPVRRPAGGAAAERLLAELRSEIGRADSKAAVLVAALGMTAGVLSGLLAGRDWSPGRLSAPSAVLWWAGAAALVLSLFALLAAVLPRYRRSRRRPGDPLTYFGDIRQAAQAGELTEALAATERDPFRALLVALRETSRIAVRKHQWIRAGLITFCTGSLLLPASVLMG